MKLDDLRAHLRTKEEAQPSHPGLLCKCGNQATKRLHYIKMPSFECACGNVMIEGPADMTRLHPSPEIVSFAPGIELSPGEDGRARVGIRAGHELCAHCRREVRVVWAEDPARFELECPICSGANLLEELMSSKKGGPRAADTLATVSRCSSCRMPITTPGIHLGKCDACTMKGRP